MNIDWIELTLAKADKKAIVNLRNVTMITPGNAEGTIVYFNQPPETISDSSGRPHTVSANYILVKEDYHAIIREMGEMMEYDRNKNVWYM